MPTTQQMQDRLKAPFDPHTGVSDYVGENKTRVFLHVLNYPGCSLTEIGRSLGLATTTVKKHLDHLRGMGLVDWVSGHKRTVHPTVRRVGVS